MSSGSYWSSRMIGHFNSAAMSARRTIGLCLALCLVLAGCTGTGAMRDLSHPVSTENSRSMEATLQQARKPVPQVVAPPPAPVVDELMGSVGAIETATEPRFDLAVQDLPAADFFMGLVQGTRYNMVVHPGVEGSISLDLKNVSLPEVMELTQQLYGYDVALKNGIYRVFPDGLRTEVFPINYLNIKRQGASDIVVSSGQLSGSVGSSGGDSGGTAGASTSTNNVLSKISTATESNFWESLERTLQVIVGGGEGRSVIANGNAGVVLVRATPDELRSVRGYLEQSELIMQRQVVLEAKILEVTLDEGFQQGINWSYFDEISSQVDAFGNPTRSIALSQSSNSLIGGDLDGIFSAALQLNDFSVFFDLLSSQGSVQVLSSPRIATLNNQKAVIKVGTDEFFVTGIETNTDNDVGDDDTTTDVEITPFFSGIALDVTPQIGENGDITLHVHPTVSEVDDQTKTIVVGDRQLILPLALSTVRETDSVIRARNGQVVVIGGLIRDVTRDSQNEVPLLGDIPIIGEAFTQKRQSQEKTELVILIRPLLADSDQQHSEMDAAEARIRQMRQRIENDYRPE